MEMLRARHTMEILRGFGRKRLKRRQMLRVSTSAARGCVFNFRHNNFKWRGRSVDVSVFSSLSRPSVHVSLPSRASHDGKGLTMKKFALAATAALALSTAPAFAADMPVKARPMAPPPPPAWDLAFGAAIASDYIWRGITQSAHEPSVASYFEPRYNVTKDLQLYVGIGGASIAFPNRAAAEIDFYAGVRPTFDKLSFDFGVWYYWYPGGQCFSTGNQPCAPSAGAALQSLPNGNFAKADASFWEVYAKVNYAVTDQFGVGAVVYYSPDVLNTGADGVYYAGNAKYTFPAMSNGMQWYASGEVGYWDLGTSDAFYGIPATVFAAGIPYASYTTWNLGFGFTWKVFTVDFRYIDTDLSKGDCNAFTSDHTAAGPTGPAITPINPSGVSSNWCDSRFVARLSADLTVNTNLK
jgi:hypothetical protein